MLEGSQMLGLTGSLFSLWSGWFFCYSQLRRTKFIMTPGYLYIIRIYDMYVFGIFI